MNKGNAVIWGTGGDGHFDVDVRLNPDCELSDEEEKMIEMSVKDCKLVVTSTMVVVGSPECAGTVEKQCLEKKFAYLVDDVTPGNYLVNVYFLFDGEAARIGDEMSGAEFREYLEKNPDFDKTGFVVILRGVGDDYEFPQVTQLPQLG
jgi:hypothetical protein